MPITGAVYSGLYVVITNKLAAIVFNINRSSDSIVVVAAVVVVVSVVHAVGGGGVDGTVSARAMT